MTLKLDYLLQHYYKMMWMFDTFTLRSQYTDVKTKEVISAAVERKKTILFCFLCADKDWQDMIRAKVINAGNAAFITIRDSHHPGNHLFELLPSDRSYRSNKTRTNRLRNSFFPKVIAVINNQS